MVIGKRISNKQQVGSEQRVVNMNAKCTPVCNKHHEEVRVASII